MVSSPEIIARHDRPKEAVVVIFSLTNLELQDRRFMRFTWKRCVADLKTEPSSPEAHAYGRASPLIAISS